MGGGGGRVYCEGDGFHRKINRQIQNWNLGVNKRQERQMLRKRPTLDNLFFFSFSFCPSTYILRFLSVFQPIANLLVLARYSPTDVKGRFCNYLFSILLDKQQPPWASPARESSSLRLSIPEVNSFLVLWDRPQGHGQGKWTTWSLLPSDSIYKLKSTNLRHTYPYSCWPEESQIEKLLSPV